MIARLLLESLTRNLDPAETEAELRTLGARLGAELKRRPKDGARADKVRVIAEIMRELAMHPPHQVPTRSKR